MMASPSNADFEQKRSALKPSQIENVPRLSSCESPAMCTASNDGAHERNSIGGVENHIGAAPQRRSVARYVRLLMLQLVSPLSPGSITSRLRWLVFILMCLDQFIYLPLVPVYFSTESHTAMQVNAVFECIYLIDIVFSFNSSYFDTRTAQLITSRREIASNYLRGWFVLDALSAFPFDSTRLLDHYVRIDPTTDHYSHAIFHGLLCLPRLLHSFTLVNQLLRFCRLLRVWKELFAGLMYSRYSHLMRIVWLLLLVVLTTHYMACCWHWIAGEDQNAPNAVVPRAPTSEQYLSDFYYCTLLLQGQGDSSGTTPMQNLFSTFAVVLGSLILAIVFGNVGMLVSNFNANSTNYQRKMETVFATMNKLQLPHDMRERISLHYEHLWEEYESLDGDIVKFSKELTHTLALEVGLYRYMNLILKISYWRRCSPDFLTQIVLNLVARVYLPDDYVLRQGEVRDEMYMVNRGLCEFADVEKTEDDSIGLSTKGSGCESSDNSAPALHVRRAYSNGTLPSSSDIDASDEAGVVHPVPSLKPVVGTSIASGESFREMALLMNYPSETGVHAATYVEMCALERTKFQQLLARYPDDRRRVLRSMLVACVDKREIPFTRKEVEQMIARKRQKPMDDSDHVSKKEFVEAFGQSGAAVCGLDQWVQEPSSSRLCR